MDKDLHKLAKSVVELQKEAVKQTLLVYKPKVELLINSNNSDKNAIEHTLDALCEVAFDNEVLLLFKKLCRYYYNIDPVATAQQIQFYREMWDNEEKPE
ncbi:MAG: hypothetical protein PHF92_09365 [Bacteroidales bacterium]|nr:hypothetical protein [Bacteroidales bacterium]